MRLSLENYNVARNDLNQLTYSPTNITRMHGPTARITTQTVGLGGGWTTSGGGVPPGVANPAPTETHNKRARYPSRLSAARTMSYSNIKSNCQLPPAHQESNIRSLNPRPTRGRDDVTLDKSYSSTPRGSPAWATTSRTPTTNKISTTPICWTHGLRGTPTTTPREESERVHNNSYVITIYVTIMYLVMKYKTTYLQSESRLTQYTCDTPITARTPTPPTPRQCEPTTPPTRRAVAPPAANDFPPMESGSAFDVRKEISASYADIHPNQPP